MLGGGERNQFDVSLAQCKSAGIKGGCDDGLTSLSAPIPWVAEEACWGRRLSCGHPDAGRGAKTPGLHPPQKRYTNHSHLHKFPWLAFSFFPAQHAPSPPPGSAQAHSANSEGRIGAGFGRSGRPHSPLIAGLQPQVVGYLEPGTREGICPE